MKATVGKRAAKGAGLVALVLHRSFSRSGLGLRLAQDQQGQQGRSWVNTSCAAIALMGLSFSFFSTRQLLDDPNARCLLWRK